ncbi:MAG: phage virion morphogenesis protein [Sulfuricellaceae bacterium]
MYSADINISPATNAFNSVLHALTGAPLLQKIAGVLEYETEENFAEQGRPNWAPLAPATKAARLKRNNGSSVLMILQDHGVMAASTSSEFGSNFALIGAGGASKDYATIQQIGGDAGKNHQAHIPGRPYLPFTGTIDAPTLQPSAEKNILELISDAARNSFR